MMRLRTVPVLLAAASLLSACTFFSTAKHWNRRVGPNGEPVYYVTVSKVGLNLAILLPFLGGTDVDELVDDVTAEIEKEGGDTVRVVQGGSENYWYGWSPFTWIVTPVISTLAVEYQPTVDAIQRDRQTEIDEAGNSEIGQKDS